MYYYYYYAPKYDPDSFEAIDIFLELANKNGYYSLSTEYVELLCELENEYMVELRKELIRNHYHFELIDDIFWRREPDIPDSYFFNLLPVNPPLNITAMLAVLYNQIVAPYRNFMNANSVIRDVLKLDILIQDGQKVFYDLPNAESDKLKSDPFWELFNAALESYPEFDKTISF